MTAAPALAPARGRVRVARLPLAAVVVGVALLAIATRLLVVRSAGGLFAIGNYDDSVYYGSAVALVHGRVPYRDFLYVQPPGITLFLTPAALLGRIIGDRDAWALARLGFVCLGGANAALIAVVLRRWGVLAALVGGLYYALVPQAMFADRTTLLEVLGGFATLVGLALLSRTAFLGSAGATPARHDLLLRVLAGVAFGFAVTAKVFFLVPLVIVALFLWRRALPFVAGAAAAMVAILLPFFASAPEAMIREVLLDQLGRARIGTDVSRLRGILEPPSLPGVPPLVVLAVVGAGALALLVLALRDRRARLFAVMTVCASALLYSAPSFYRHYAVLAIVPLALMLGAVVGPLLDGLLARGGAPRRLAVAAVLALLVLVPLGAWRGTGLSAVSGAYPAPGLGAAVRAVPGCVPTLTPALLLLTDTEGLQFDRGCPVRIDPTGYVYDRDFDRGVAPSRNARWQAEVTAYLTSGRAALLRNADRWFDASTKARLLSGRVLFAAPKTRLVENR